MPTRDPSFEPDPSASRLPGGFLAQAGPFLLLLAVIGFLAYRWPAIRDPFISHWGAGFQPDGWSERTPVSVFALPLYGLFCCFMMVVAARAILRPEPEPGGPHSLGEPGRHLEGKRRRASAGLILAAEWMMAVVFAPIALHPLVQGRGQAAALLVSVLAVSTVGSIVLVVGAVVRMGRLGGGSGSQQGGGREEGWRWAGLVYWNAEDPALFVEKKVGLGHTVNLGHREAWIYLFTFLGGTAVFLLALILG